MTDIKEQIEAALEAEKVVEVVEEAPVEHSDFEKKMIEKGWDPQGKKTAEEWLDAGFEIRGKRMDTLYKTVDYLKQERERAVKEAYDKALASLKEQKIEAIRAADPELVQHIEQQEKTLFNPQQELMINEFRSKHSEWLEGTSHLDLKMAEVCHKKDNELVARGLPLDKHLEALENYMIGEFPQYFNKSVANAPPEVEGGQSQVVHTSKKGFTIDQLTAEEKKVGQQLEKMGVMKMDAYVKDIAKMRGTR